MPLRILNCKSPLKFLQYHNSYTVPKKFLNMCFIHKTNIEKLEHRALKCVFIGYSSTQKGYKCYHPPTIKYFVSIDVTFRW